VELTASRACIVNVVSDSPCVAPAAQDGCLAMEVCRVILDVFDKLLGRPVSSSRVQDVAVRFFAILSQLLECNLSERVALQALGTLKLFIYKVRSRAGWACAQKRRYD